MKEVGIGLAILVLLIGMLMSVWLDIDFAASWHLGFYLFAVMPLLVASLARRERIVQFAMVVYLAVLVVLPFIDLSPVKPFTRFYSEVKPGMIEAEVLSRLARQFPDGGRFPCPVQRKLDDGSLWFQLDPNNGAYNAELVIVKMSEGSTVSKEYLPD